MSKELEALERGILEFEKDLEDDCNNEWLKRVVAGMKKCYQRLEAIDKQRCGANVEKVIIDEFVPNEALECLKDLEHNIMLVDDSYAVKKDYSIIEQTLLKAQEQEKILNIIIDREVSVQSFRKKNYKDYEDYRYRSNIYENSTLLTQEEFDLLKRWLDEKENW